MLCNWASLSPPLPPPSSRTLADAVGKRQTLQQSKLSEEEMPQQVKLSAHDIVAGLLWLTCCEARCRPLPGQPMLTAGRSRGAESGMCGLLGMCCGYCATSRAVHAGRQHSQQGP